MEYSPHIPAHGHGVPRRRRKRQEPHVNHERWLVSYADFITLLFAFFTMLYAMSTVDAAKFKQVVAAMQIAFENQGFDGTQGQHALDVGGGASPGGDAVLDAANGVGPDDGSGLDALQRQMTERLSEAISLNQVAIERDARGLIVSIREAGSFGVGSADLSPTAAAVLDQIGDVLGNTPNAIRVEGHTDDIPINTARFHSNWELSTTRATNVIAFLVERQHVGANRLSAAGYAEFHPQVANDSPENRARNRRVDIVILNPAIARAEEPALNGGPQ